MLVAAGTDRPHRRESRTVNLTNHLRRSVVAAAVATTVIGGAAGTTHADTAPTITPVTVLAAPASTAAHPPTPRGTLAAVTAPTAPRSVTSTPGNTKVKLAWLAPVSSGGAAINKYRVQRARAGGPWKTIAYPTTRHYTATGLTNGTRYYFRVVAHNTAGWSKPSTVISTVPRTVPTAPRSPTATPGNATVKLAWLRPSSNGGVAINKYRVQRATNAGGPWKTIAYPTTRSHTAKGLTNGTKYYFRVVAHNTAGWSKPSTVISAVPHTVPSAPLSPVATPGNSSVTLSWKPPSNTGGAKIDEYTVQTPNFGVWTDIASTTGLTYTATQLWNGTPYTYRIVALNTAGWGTPSLPVQAVPFTSPAAPMKLTATSGKDWINLTWNPPLGDGGRPVKAYRVWRATSLNGPYYWMDDVQTLSYTQSPLSPGTAYYYKVAACNVAGCGPSSNTAYANVPTLPSQPATCQATQLNGKGSDWVRVQWTPPSNSGGAPILNYSIRITDFGIQATVYKTAKPAGNATAFDIYMPADTGASEQSGKYYYSVWVEAKNAAGVGPSCADSLDMEP
jgi:fibronectin type 3 domain-containing protein